MSENLPQNNSNEEVDIIVLIRLINRGLGRLFGKIGNFFKNVFSGFIYLLKPIVQNIKIITIILFAGAILGLITEKFSDPVYVSDMLVKPYFDSKFQLANNVNYFNALIGSNNLQELSNIFEIDTVTASNLLGFEMVIGPETQNDLLREYDNYIKSIDSTLAADVSYDEYIENRDILAGKIFSIKAKSSTHDIFPSLKRGFIKTFENEYSRKMKRVRDSTILVRKAYYKVQLNRVDSLQKVYLNILEKESNKEQLSIGSSGLLPVTQERMKTREYELFQDELGVRNAIRSLDEKLIEESDFYDILSDFEEVGTVEMDIFKRYSIVFPAILLAFMTLLFFFLRVFNFIKNYD